MTATAATPQPQHGPNQALHNEAVQLLLKCKSLRDEGKDYNARRKAATARRRQVLSEIWKKFEAGESVGGHHGKEEWCSAVGVGIRWCQKIIAGRKANSVRAKRISDGDVVDIKGNRYIMMMTSGRPLLIEECQIKPKAKRPRRVKKLSRKETEGAIYKALGIGGITGCDLDNREGQQLYETLTNHSDRMNWNASVFNRVYRAIAYKCLEDKPVSDLAQELSDATNGAEKCDQVAVS